MLAIRRLTFLLLVQGFSYGIPVFTKMFQGSLSIEEDELDLDSNLEDGGKDIMKIPTVSINKEWKNQL
ncbi:hypothetical protein PVK06_003012 [Gossypium arboreum]|uniref:Uncharacterized protein n=1 Tax=Gossypium arboreum TaxID=29729 RepID=A0ABR0R563_GOSAR|nr:hypothetical protein PVK06_003012 [Gossypium arboreum]